MQVFSPKLISPVVSFSRIFSVHQEHVFSGTPESLLFIFFTAKCQARMYSLYFFFIFSIWLFFHEHSRITGLQGKGKGISLTPYYHFHPLHRHLDISRAITAESSPLHIGSSRTRTGNLWFPSASPNH